jgi:predicted nucleic acid-binding protein
MILVDTSIWVDHLRKGVPALAELLNTQQVLIHPFVLGELACGNLANRKEIVNLFGKLPQAVHATDSEVLFYIERHSLMGKGIGYVDAHLLASVALTGKARLWTTDKRLEQIASNLNVAYKTVQ